MQFQRKTSNSFTTALIRLLIKAIILFFIISIIVFIVDKIDLPAPNKQLQKKISNEQFTIVK